MLTHFSMFSKAPGGIDLLKDGVSYLRALLAIEAKSQTATVPPRCAVLYQGIGDGEKSYEEKISDNVYPSRYCSCDNKRR